MKSSLVRLVSILAQRWSIRKQVKACPEDKKVCWRANDWKQHLGDLSTLEDYIALESETVNA